MTLKAKLRAQAGGTTPREVLAKFKTMQMVDVHLPTTDGRELTFGVSGNIVTNADATINSALAATSGVTANLLAVGYWDDVGFLATGANGTILNSPDGLTWARQPIPATLAILWAQSFGSVISEAKAAFDGPVRAVVCGETFEVSRTR